ncbi:MAG: U32 family peptidase C-terminal domain-containing protein, partial [Vibrionaceae bacterium]
AVPQMEIEVFVHGALCMAYSGRCLLSGYINKRDPNQGTCTNACRWSYNVHPATEDSSGQIVNAAPAATTLGLGTHTSQPFLLEEQGRPGELMAAFEDEHGTYIMNSKDLRAVEHVAKLTQMGVHSLKIEGRTKSFYYCARTAQVYRQAIDDAMAGKPFDAALLTTLESLAHRGYTEGFLRRHHHSEYQNYDYGYSVSTLQQFVGEFTGERCGELALVEVKNKFVVGDELEIMTPEKNITFTLTQMQDKKGNVVDDAKGNGHFMYIPVPADLDLQFALLMRNLPQGTSTRNVCEQPLDIKEIKVK